MLAMAGYSGTPLPKKLGIKPGHRVAFAGAPDGFAVALGELPPGVEHAPAAGPADVIVAFVRTAAEAESRLAELKPRLAFDGGLWIGWPKKSSPLSLGLSENAIREVGLAAGLVDNKVCAIDEDWSGLRFVYRREDRPANAGR
jgi:hypothetical protein